MNFGKYKYQHNKLELNILEEAWPYLRGVGQVILHQAGVSTVVGFQGTEILEMMRHGVPMPKCVCKNKADDICSKECNLNLSHSSKIE